MRGICGPFLLYFGICSHITVVIDLLMGNVSMLLVEDHMKRIQCKFQLVLTHPCQVICVFNLSKVIFWSKFTIFGHFAAIMDFKFFIFVHHHMYLVNTQLLRPKPGPLDKRF